MQAVEKRTIQKVIADLPSKEKGACWLISRLKHNNLLPNHPLILDVGTAQGSFLISCAKLGYQAVGVEPSEIARKTGEQLARRMGFRLEVRAGYVEDLPFQAETFDIVHALSVIEHVADVKAAFAEVYRVLKPGGIFWFNGASALHPFQKEIQGFPLFGWYPDRLKRKIMYWAREHKPELVGHTETPAINWFTPWKARRLLFEAGFSKVYDQWDLDRERHYSLLHRVVVSLIRSSFITKIVADILLGGCSFTCLK
jgi:SAM-dependent methyltransferase